jgi:hypothetical protein
MYVCRTLSYKGADFDIVEAPLEERMMVKNTKYWHIFRVVLNSWWHGTLHFMFSTTRRFLIH